MSKKLAVSLLLVMLGLVSWEAVVTEVPVSDVKATADGTPLPN